MLIGILVELHVMCPKCMSALPPNGVCSSIACYACGHTTALPEEFWKQRFEPDSFEPLLLEEGQSDTSNVVRTKGLECRLRYGKEMPLCAACCAPLDASGLAAAATFGSITCGCGRATRVRVADDLSRHIESNAVLLVGETSRTVDHVRKPVIFNCTNCGGALQVDGSARTITCIYCSVASYLPDGVWQVLYPTPTLQPFYVVSEYDEAGLREVRWQDYEQRARDAARADLTVELYARLAKDDDDAVREALAKNRAVAPEILARLVHDDEDDVRCAAVANPAAPTEALDRLAAKERDPDVLKALVARADQTPSIVSALAQSEHTAARLAAVRHPGLPLTTLRSLASDREDEVKYTAKARIKELRAQGIEVPGGGFFAKLFGG